MSANSRRVDRNRSAGKGDYEANAAAYLVKLDALEGEVRDTLAKVPPDRRRVVTSHNAFGYLERLRHPFHRAAGRFDGLKRPARTSPLIVHEIRAEHEALGREHSRAVVVSREQIAGETGVKVGGVLYSDALTDASGDAPTYIDLIRHNLRQLASALTS